MTWWETLVPVAIYVSTPAVLTAAIIFLSGMLNDVELDLAIGARGVGLATGRIELVDDIVCSDEGWWPFDMFAAWFIWLVGLFFGVAAMMKFGFHYAWVTLFTIGMVSFMPLLVLEQSINRYENIWRKMRAILKRASATGDDAYAKMTLTVCETLERHARQVMRWLYALPITLIVSGIAGGIIWK